MEIESCSRSIICFQGSNGRVGRCHCLCSWRHGFLTQLWSQRARFHVLNSSRWLGCKDAAKWPPHSCPTRRCARDATACASNRIQLAVVVVVVFFFFVSGFAPTHTNSAPTRADSRRTGLIQTKSAKYQCVSAGKRKSAGKGKKKKLKPKIPVDWTGYWYAAVAGGLKSYLCFFVFFFASSSWVSTDYWVVLFYFFFLEEFCNFCFTFW